MCEPSDVSSQFLLWVQILLALTVSAKRAENEKSWTERVSMKHVIGFILWRFDQGLGHILDLSHIRDYSTFTVASIECISSFRRQTEVLYSYNDLRNIKIWQTMIQVFYFRIIYIPAVLSPYFKCFPLWDRHPEQKVVNFFIFYMFKGGIYISV